MWGSVIAKFAGVLIATLLLTLIYFAGMQSGINKTALECQTEKIAAIERAIQQANQIARENAEVAFAHVNTVERIKVVYQRIEVKTDEHLAQHPALDSCDIGADGLRLWNSANTSARPPQ